MKGITAVLAAFFLARCSVPLQAAPLAGAEQGLQLIPYPRTVTLTAGAAPVKFSGRVAASDASLAPLAPILADELHAVTGTPVTVADGQAKPGDIVLENAAMTGEAYEIAVTDRITLRAGNYAAAAMGSATLLQAVQVSRSATPTVTFPKIKVEDEPAITFRGAMLDLARSTHSPDSIKEIIRLCSFYKVRQLHLHLSDDQSFTFPSTAFPKLPTPHRSYTSQQMKDLVAYATARGVTIVPELDMPGHATALMGAMPEIFKMERGGNVIDFRKPEVIEAAGKLVDELCEMFPDSPYIHLGGDEANLSAFENDPATDAAMKAAGVTEIQGLFNYFLNQMNAHVKAHGKKSIIWEGSEVYDGGPSKLDEDIIIEPFDNYRSVQTTYIDHGHDTVNTSWYPLYLLDGILTTPKNLYDWNLYLFGTYKSFSPRNPGNVAQYTVTKVDKVLGAQMSSWEAPQKAEVPLFRRRLPAMMERVWLRVPRKTSFTEFSKRLDATDARLTALLSTSVPFAVNATASDSVYADRVEVQWTPAQGYAESYTVLRGLEEDATKAKAVATNLTATKWTDKTAAKGQSYYYWVYPKNSFGENDKGEPSKGSVGTNTKIAVAYEGFAPKLAGEGGAIAGAGGGVGWAGPWKMNHADGATLSVVPQGLTYPGMATSGGALAIDITDDKGGIEIQRQTTAAQVAPGAQTWVSYLLKVKHAGDGHFLLLINNSGEVSIGKEWGRGLGIVGRPGTFAAEDGKTYLLVTQITCLNGYDVVRSWVNPMVGTPPSPDSPDVSFRDDIDAGRPSDIIRLQVQQHGHGSYEIDEIRIGNSFADVTPKSS